MHVISLGSAFYTIKAMAEVVAELQRENSSVRHTGITMDSWYSPVRVPAGQAYDKLGMKCYPLPRPSGSLDDIWTIKNYSQELDSSFFAIKTFLAGLLGSEPTVFMLCDVNGDLEKYCVDFFVSQDIPVIFMEHGLRYDFLKILGDKIPHEWYQKSIFKNKEIAYKHSELQRSVTTCCFSSLSCLAMSKKTGYGLDSHEGPLFVTGFPYYDAVYRNRVLLSPERVKSDLRCLVLSSGRGAYLKTSSREVVRTNMCLGMMSHAQGLMEIRFRMKPNESFNMIFTSEQRDRYEKMNVLLDNNTIPSYDALLKYDIVIGFFSSVMVEAMILGIPIIILSENPDEEIRSDGKIYIAYKYIKPIIVPNLDEVDTTLEYALSGEYRAYLQRQFAEHGHLLLGNVDGMAGGHVAQIAVQAVSEAGSRSVIRV